MGGKIFAWLFQRADLRRKLQQSKALHPRALNNFVPAPVPSFFHLMFWGSMLVGKDATYAHRIAAYSDPGVIGSAAGLALQPRLGLLPQRWIGNSADYRDRLDAVV